MDHLPALHRRPSFAAAMLVWAMLSLAGSPAWAQATSPRDPLDTGPRGLVDTTIAPARAPASKPPPAAALAEQPLPPFGAQIFGGRFANQSFTGYNGDHQIAIGDRIAMRMWGAFTFDAVLVVDPQGNIFIPNVGPVRVLGVRNRELHATVEASVARTFRNNVGVYASLESVQPVKMYVTGYVRVPGLYAGLSSDSVLHYLDMAGGIDPDRGSYLAVEIRRGGALRTSVNLYDFLLQGTMPPMQLQDGDTLFVRARQSTVTVSGEVQNAYRFEFGTPEIAAADLLALARPQPGATHLSIVRQQGREQRSEYHAIAEAASARIRDGDEVLVTSDRYPATILVRIEGAHVGERSMVLPYGARLKDALARMRPTPQAAIEKLQLFRRSVAQRQKTLIESSLRSLETYALTARSATSEEAALREREARQILEFIDRARGVVPKGQVILSQSGGSDQMLLEDGDVLQVPERSDLVIVAGEVLFPNALSFQQGSSADQYVTRAGGFTQGADEAKVVLLRQDGSVAAVKPGLDIQPGDEIMVLPKIETKNVEVTRGLTQIVYQIAIAAKVLFGL